MVTATLKQQNNAYMANCVLDWRDKGLREWEIHRMLLETCEYVAVMGIKDIPIILDIANGKRCV